MSHFGVDVIDPHDPAHQTIRGVDLDHGAVEGGHQADDHTPEWCGEHDHRQEVGTNVGKDSDPVFIPTRTVSQKAVL